MSGLSRLRPYIGVKEGFKGLRLSVWGLMFRFRGQMAGGGGFLSKFVSILGFWRFGPQTCANLAELANSKNGRQTKSYKKNGGDGNILINHWSITVTSSTTTTSIISIVTIMTDSGIQCRLPELLQPW